MRQALRSGKWVYRLPLGYKKVNEKIVRDEKKAALILEGFETIAYKGISAEETRKMLLKKGLEPCSKQNFLDVLRNLFYTGSYIIKEWKEEAQEIVKGDYEAIISKELFNLVQETLNGKKKKVQLNINRNEFLPLRGFLLCNKCNKNLTGSPSRSQNQTQYFYYHCQHGCKERFRADIANEAFLSYLQSFKVSKEIISLYFEILKDTFKDNQKEREVLIKEIDSQIASWEKRQEAIELKYMDDEIDTNTYKNLKIKIENELNDLHKKRIELGADKATFNNQLTYSASLLLNMYGYYKSADIDTRQRLISSIFAEKLIFDGKNYRTNKMNELLSILTSNSNDFEKSENKKADRHAGFLTFAPSPGLEPGTP